MSILLDSTCGYRLKWKKGIPDNYVGVDIRSEVNPDIVADTKKLPIKNGVIRFIHFDPPHHKPAKGFWGNRSYGEGLTPAQRLKLFVEVNKEFHRVINKDGLVIAKITNMPKNPGYSSKNMDKTLERELTNFKLITKSSRPSRGFSSSATLNWMCFRPRTVGGDILDKKVKG